MLPASALASFVCVHAVAATAAAAAMGARAHGNKNEKWQNDRASINFYFATHFDWHCFISFGGAFFSFGIFGSAAGGSCVVGRRTVRFYRN